MEFSKEEADNIARLDEYYNSLNEKRYNPEIEIVDPNKFSETVEKLFSQDLMQLKNTDFRNNYDSVYVNFDTAHISTNLGDYSTIFWDGVTDEFEYSITSHSSPYLLESIFQLEIPAYKISPDWQKIIEKHEDPNKKEILFDVDIAVQSKKGIMYLSEIEEKEKIRVARFLKKPISNKQ